MKMKKPSELWRAVVSQNKADVSEMRTTSIIRSMRKMTEAVRISETTVYFKKTTRRHVPGGCLSIFYAFYETASAKYRPNWS
jgi:hypothetical protein